MRRTRPRITFCICCIPLFFLHPSLFIIHLPWMYSIVQSCKLFSKLKNSCSLQMGNGPSSIFQPIHCPCLLSFPALYIINNGENNRKLIGFLLHMFQEKLKRRPQSSFILQYLFHWTTSNFLMPFRCVFILLKLV